MVSNLPAISIALSKAISFTASSIALLFISSNIFPYPIICIAFTKAVSKATLSSSSIASVICRKKGLSFSLLSGCLTNLGAINWNLDSGSLPNPFGSPPKSSSPSSSLNSLIISLPTTSGSSATFWNMLLLSELSLASR